MPTKTTPLDAKTRRILEAAEFDIDALTFIPRAAIHDFMVRCDAWLDADAGLLLFVNEHGESMGQFLYYIGEEHNRNVVGVGRDVVAYQLDDERVEMLLAYVASHHAKATA